VLLVGPEGHGGEGVYLDTLRRHPPDAVAYTPTGRFHTGAPGVPCRRAAEIALNQVVHRLAVPDMGFRAFRVRDPFDVVHVHAHPVSLRGLRGTPLVMSEGSSSAVYIGEYLGWDDERLRKGYGRSRRLYRALGIADRLLTLEKVTRAYVFSDWARQVNIRWGADPDKMEVIFPGFPVQPPRDGASTSEEFTFLFVGGDFERKGGFELVEAFARLVGEFPNARLVLAGTDPHERNPDRLIHSWVSESRRGRVLEQLAQLERDGTATRTPWVDRQRLLTEFFPRADAFVMPSHAEGFGFTNAEALSFSLPVITSTAGPTAEIVDDGRTGALVPPGDIEALVEAMARLVGDRDAAARMGSAARAAFLERFTIERLRARLGDFYRRALTE
jgi:glycosyltransferase involved in cell wall biosynthesis